MSVVAIVSVLAGLAALGLGGRFLVEGSSKLAAAMGISPLVIGLTVVAFGTSAPELAVSVQSAYAGQPDIAIGNAVGSNIFNVLFILGISAIITPLVVSQQLVRLDTPLMVGACVLVYIMSFDGVLSWSNGLLLAACVVAYTVFAIRQSRREPAAVVEEYEREYGNRRIAGTRSWAIVVLSIVGGLALLVVGASLIVDGAVILARSLGVSELVIGLTIVAAGTSLPEVAASITASIRKEPDIAVGNIVGSNLFNMLAVLGFSSLVAPSGLPVSREALEFDIPVMIGVSIACLPIFFSGYRIARWEGGLLFAYWIAYTSFLVLDSQGHVASKRLTTIMMEFVLPLTLITVATIAVRHLREKKATASG